MLDTDGMPPTRPDADIPVSEELFAPVHDGVELCYQTFGDPDDEPLLLVMGLGGPMTWWDPELCRQLAARGHFVIRYDNRDTGRSTRMKERVGRTALVRAFAGRAPRPPYTLTDMAGDGLGLLDHLGLDGAHVVGISMGGMIVQNMAITAPGRVRSLTSIMSTTGKRSVGWQHPRLLPTLIAPRGSGREAYAAGSARMWELIGSPAYPQSDDEVLARAFETFDRGVSASGVMRQMLAILAEPNRGPRLRALSMPALVIHGAADRMVHVSGGRATARAIPGA
jgi:pimeloyl-ACP methyl ester carboxylesterase